MKKEYNCKAQEKKTSHRAKQGEKTKRQRNAAQMKEPGTNLQDQRNKEEISNLPEREFRIRQ